MRGGRCLVPSSPRPSRLGPAPSRAGSRPSPPVELRPLTAFSPRPRQPRPGPLRVRPRLPSPDPFPGPAPGPFAYELGRAPPTRGAHPWPRPTLAPGPAPPLSGPATRARPARAPSRAARGGGERRTARRARGGGSAGPRLRAGSMGNKQTIFTEEQLDNYQVSRALAGLPKPGRPQPQFPCQLATLGPRPPPSLCSLGPQSGLRPPRAGWSFSP